MTNKWIIFIGSFLLIFLGMLGIFNPVVLIASSLISGFIFIIIAAFLVVSLATFLMFYGLIPGISRAVSKLCIYHKLKTDTNEEGETLWKKIILVFAYNFLLTLPMLLTILYLLNPSTLKINEQFTGIDIGFIIALSMIPGLFITLRLIGNPTQYGISFLKGYFVVTKPFFGNPSEIQKIKDDISSFYSTLIIATILFLLLLYCSDYFSSHSYLTFFYRYIPSISPMEFSWYIIGYLGTLFIVTIIGEIILKQCVPLDRK
jgi:hypothetical protein